MIKILTLLTLPSLYETSAHETTNEWKNDTYFAAKRHCSLPPVLVNNLDLFAKCWGQHPSIQNLSFWVPARKKRSEVWIYPNGTYFAKEIVPAGSKVPGQDCTLIRTEDKFLDEIFCNAKAWGVMCSFKGRVDCPLKAECLYTERHKYALFRQEVNFFEAFEKCRGMGLQLASVDRDKMARRETIEEISKEINPHGHFYMEMVRSIWIADDKNENGIFEQGMLQQFHWTEGEPLPENECAIAFLKTAPFNSTWAWKSADCNKKHYFLCSDDLKDNCSLSPGSSRRKEPLSKSTKGSPKIGESAPEVSLFGDKSAGDRTETIKVRLVAVLVVSIICMACAVVFCIAGCVAYKRLSKEIQLISKMLRLHVEGQTCDKNNENLSNQIPSVFKTQDMKENETMKLLQDSNEEVSEEVSDTETATVVECHNATDGSVSQQKDESFSKETSPIEIMKGVEENMFQEGLPD